jgi:hypothetical protein
MKELLTVFLCSTYSDLVQERAAVIQAVQRLKLQHDAMEFFGARPSRAIETCLKEVRGSDLLVVIVAHRYGSFIPDEKISYTEAEYREGHRLGKPCLVYFRDERVPVLPGNFETRAGGLRALRRFKDLLHSRHTVHPFKDAHDLALQVAVDIAEPLEALKSTASAAARHPQPDPEVRFRELWEEAMGTGLDPAELHARMRRAVSGLLVAEHRRPPRVLLSHAQADGEVVRAFGEGLRRQGVELWPEAARAASDDNIVEQISRGLEQADFVVFFMSSVSLSRRSTTIELNYAILHRLTSAGGARIVPVLLDDVAIPSVLNADSPCIDLRDGDVRRAVEVMMGTIRQSRDDG